MVGRQVLVLLILVRVQAREQVNRIADLNTPELNQIKSIGYDYFANSGSGGGGGSGGGW